MTGETVAIPGPAFARRGKVASGNSLASLPIPMLKVRSFGVLTPLTMPFVLAAYFSPGMGGHRTRQKHKTRNQGDDGGSHFRASIG
jgi:hypothetical protein